MFNQPSWRVERADVSNNDNPVLNHLTQIFQLGAKKFLDSKQPEWVYLDCRRGWVSSSPSPQTFCGSHS